MGVVALSCQIIADWNLTKIYKVNLPGLKYANEASEYAYLMKGSESRSARSSNHDNTWLLAVLLALASANQKKKKTQQGFSRH